MFIAQNNAANFHTCGEPSTSLRDTAVVRLAVPTDSRSLTGNGFGSSAHNAIPIAAPQAAIQRKACRHPTAAMIGATINGARPGPIPLADIITPVTVARFPGVVRSATALNDAGGKQP